MKISDNALTFGTGNHGVTRDPSDKENMISKTEPVLACIGKLDELVSYMQICLAETEDSQLERIYETYCSLLVILPYDGVTEIVDPIGEGEDDMEVRSQIVSMYLVSEHTAKIIGRAKVPPMDRLKGIGALHLNYLRSLARSFERELYGYLLSKSALVRGASEKFQVIARNNVVHDLKEHFAMSTLTTFANIASDYVMLLAYRLESEQA